MWEIYCSFPDHEVNAFLTGLTRERFTELMNIHREWDEMSGVHSLNRRLVVVGVVKDWLEEHGGERGWWSVLRTRWVEEHDHVESVCE